MLKKTDRSFKDHTSGFYRCSPLTVSCLYLTLTYTIFPCMLWVELTLDSVCVSMLLWKCTCRDLLMISDLFYCSCQNALCILRTRPRWRISRHPRHSRFGCQKLFILEACLHVWKSKPDNKLQTDMDVDGSNILWMLTYKYFNKLHFM